MSDITYIDRQSGKLTNESVPSGKVVNWLYTAPLGKVSLAVLLKRKFVSALGGWFMNSRLSKKQIDKFITQYGIDLNEYQQNDSTQFKSFNDFFCRKIKPEERPLGEGVISPADGKALAFQSTKDVSSFFIKGSEFTLSAFLKNEQLAKKYSNGTMVIIRLAPTDYHRFHFPASGVISQTNLIKGHYYSVSPLALQKSLRIFCENKRTVSTLSSPEFGDILISEIGATMVGSILQTYSVDTQISKGDEKGYFAFGGSTVVLLFEPSKVKLAADILKNTSKGLETTVKVGETIAL